LRGDVARGFDALLPSWSPLANLGWKLTDRALEAQALAYNEAARAADQGPRPYAVLGPTPRPATDAELIAYGADVWAECARMIHATCAARGVPSFHFLQPNQYVPGSKPIGPAERAVAVHEDHPTRFAVEQGYPVLQARGEELRAAGIDYQDLTGIFAGIEEPLYVDACCHLGPRGNELMALEIARRIGPRLGAAAPVPALRSVSDTAVRLEAPLARGRAAVIGTLDDGSTVDVTYACRGFTSSDPDVVRVDAYGGLTALRSGSVTITARLGDLDVAIPVEVALPEIAILDAQSMRPGPTAPGLRGRVQGEVLEAWLDPPPPPGAAGGLVVGGVGVGVVAS
ncbi:MAG: Ig-like domain-containing protein, partial [Planctomycetota bacterium]